MPTRPASSASASAAGAGAPAPSTAWRRRPPGATSVDADLAVDLGELDLRAQRGAHREQVGGGGGRERDKAPLDGRGERAREAVGGERAVGGGGAVAVGAVHSERQREGPVRGGARGRARAAEARRPAPAPGELGAECGDGAARDARAQARDDRARGVDARAQAVQRDELAKGEVVDRGGVAERRVGERVGRSRRHEARLGEQELESLAGDILEDDPIPQVGPPGRRRRGAGCGRCQRGVEVEPAGVRGAGRARGEGAADLDRGRRRPGLGGAVGEAEREARAPAGGVLEDERRAGEGAALEERGEDGRGVEGCELLERKLAKGEDGSAQGGADGVEWRGGGAQRRATRVVDDAGRQAGAPSRKVGRTDELEVAGLGGRRGLGEGKGGGARAQEHELQARRRCR
jgi:hypothetical protein